MGLRRPPFSIRVEQDFYYPFPSFEQRLSILRRLVTGRDFLILVIGEKGSGKTMLLNRFLSSADSDWRKCRIKARITKSNSNGPSLNNLDNHPAYILQDNSLPIVLFDDAHELSVIELKYLLKDALTPDSSKKLKRLVLFCEPQIKSAMTELASSIDRMTTINKLYMPGLNEKETSEYLIHRLGIAGFRKKNPFKPSMIKSLHRTANGLPGYINLEAHKVLRQKYKGDGFPGFLNFKKRAFNRIAGLMGLLLLVTFTFVAARSYMDDAEGFSVDRNRIQHDTPLNSTPAAIPAESSDTGEEKTKQVPAPGQNGKRPDISKHEVPGRQRITLTAGSFGAKHKKPGTIHREKWLLGQNSSAYTIQIIGVRKKDALVKFIKKHKLPSMAKVAYYQTEYKGAPWYQAVYGIYPSRKEARKAIQNLPKEISKLSPWVRRLSSVKSTIMNKQIN